jgi:VanZ family protein
MALVLVATHIPQEVMPKVLNRHLLDKVEHMGAYGLITILFLLSLPHGGSRIPAVVGLLVLAGVGILDEATQPLVNRVASVGDYVSDLIGIALAGLLFLVKKRLEADTVCS